MNKDEQPEYCPLQAVAFICLNKGRGKKHQPSITFAADYFGWNTEEKWTFVMAVDDNKGYPDSRPEEYPKHFQLGKEVREALATL